MQHVRISINKISWLSGNCLSLSLLPGASQRPCAVGRILAALFPVLARRAQAMRRERSWKFLRKGEISAALEDACSIGLWSHALAVSRLLAPHASDTVLLKFVEAAKLREISEKVLSGWPAFAALFSLLLPGEYRNVAVTFIEYLAARL